MKILSTLLFLLPFVNGNFEIDIDKKNNSTYLIIVDNKSFFCTPKTPPLSHGWSYECAGTSQRYLHACDCKNCSVRKHLRS